MTYPTEWEYQRVNIMGDLVGGLNKAGKDRWEFCGILGVATNAQKQPVGHLVLMKRPRALIDTNLSHAPQGSLIRSGQ